MVDLKTFLQLWEVGAHANFRHVYAALELFFDLHQRNSHIITSPDEMVSGSGDRPGHMTVPVTVPA